MIGEQKCVFFSWLKDSEISRLEESNRNLDEQLQSAMEDVGDKTTELESVSIVCHLNDWRRGSVIITSFFGWQTFPDLRLMYG